MPAYGERTGMFQVGGGEDNRISVVYGLVCRYSYKLVVAYQRAIFGRCDDIMGIYPQTLRFSVAYPLTAFAYMFGMLAAAFIFGENIPITRWIGVGLIIVGVMLIVK